MHPTKGGDVLTLAAYGAESRTLACHHSTTSRPTRYVAGGVRCHELACNDSSLFDYIRPSLPSRSGWDVPLYLHRVRAALG